MKFKGKWVSIEQDEPFEEQAGTGRMKQHLPYFRNLSTGQKMCAIFGTSWSGSGEAGGLPVRPHRQRQLLRAAKDLRVKLRLGHDYHGKSRP